MSWRYDRRYASAVVSSSVAASYAQADRKRGSVAAWSVHHPNFAAPPRLGAGAEAGGGAGASTELDVEDSTLKQRFVDMGIEGQYVGPGPAEYVDLALTDRALSQRKAKAKAARKKRHEQLKQKLRNRKRPKRPLKKLLPVWFDGERGAQLRQAQLHALRDCGVYSCENAGGLASHEKWCTSNPALLSSALVDLHQRGANIDRTSDAHALRPLGQPGRV